MRFCLIMSLCAGLASILAGASPGSAAYQAPYVVRRFEPQANVCRAGRPERVTALIANNSESRLKVRALLRLPDGVRALDNTAKSVVLSAGGEQTLQWMIEAKNECGGELFLRLISDGNMAVSASIRIKFMPSWASVVAKKMLPDDLSYIPEPQPVRTDILIGAHHCPLWESDRPEIWNNVLKHLERTPALGFYSQDNPEIADWETKWAVEHGISFFVYCWYRVSQGESVKMNYGSAIHDALFKSRYADRMQYAIMWENQTRGKAGVADADDLFNNLLPFWLENYFKHPSYLKLDNKPVLFVYRPEYLIQDLGSKEAVAKAFEGMRQVCRQHGFDGLTILGEYRGLDEQRFHLLRELGIEATFPYCWPIPDSPPPEQAVAKQLDYMRIQRDLNILPQVVTVSQAWSGWRNEGSVWKIPPGEFENLLRQTKEFVKTLPENSIGRRLLLLDNWNEWGEGHYIAPYREYGFGYLDAVREVFAPQSAEHVDLLPEDIGMGPYDTAIRTILHNREELRKMARRRVLKSGIDDEGLIGWWAFDEEPKHPVALDYTGNRNGGVLLGATRLPGVDGNALVCTGGCVQIHSAQMFNVSTALTVSCWVKTEMPDQNQAWIVNRIQGGGENTGFRLGIMSGKPCFSVPVSAWSHTVTAKNRLPLGRWVKLTGIYDGTRLSIYIDGTLNGTLPRSGKIGANSFPVYLGSFSKNHSAHFQGVLDEVKIYNRVIKP